MTTRCCYCASDFPDQFALRDHWSRDHSFLAPMLVTERPRNIFVAGVPP